MEYEKGEKECIKPRAGDADLWIKICEELDGLVERGILVEVEHVKAHRTKKDKQHMSHLEQFVTEGNEKADELAKRRSVVGRKGSWWKQEQKLCSRKERRCMQHCSFHCLVGQWKDCEELGPKPKERWIFVDKRREETKQRWTWSGLFLEPKEGVQSRHVQMRSCKTSWDKTVNEETTRT